MKRFYSSTRQLHLYAGLFLSPFILVFAVSTLMLNHPGLAASDRLTAAAVRKESVPIDVPPEVGTIDQAKMILAQLHVTGEIDYVRHNAKAERLFIPVSKPGQNTKVEVDLRAKTASVERQEGGLGAALVYLHKMPGPHNVKFRGNWVYMAWWKIAADGVVYGTLFLTFSGLYLWWALKAERVVGWAMIGAGVFSAAVLIAAMAAA